MLCTINPEPIKSEWEQEEHSPPAYMHKEVLGAKSLLNWHCGLRMLRILRFEKSINDGEIRRTNYRGWICRVCEHRKCTPTDM